MWKSKDYLYRATLTGRWGPFFPPPRFYIEALRTPLDDSNALERVSSSIGLNGVDKVCLYVRVREYSRALFAKHGI